MLVFVYKQVFLYKITKVNGWFEIQLHAEIITVYELS